MPMLMRNTNKKHCPVKMFRQRFYFISFIVLYATFNNISAISWRPVLAVEEAGVPGEKHLPWTSNW